MICRCLEGDVLNSQLLLVDLWTEGYSAEDIISTVFRIVSHFPLKAQQSDDPTKNYRVGIEEPIKLEFLKVGFNLPTTRELTLKGNRFCALENCKRACDVCSALGTVGKAVRCRSFTKIINRIKTSFTFINVLVLKDSRERSLARAGDKDASLTGLQQSSALRVANGAFGALLDRIAEATWVSLMFEQTLFLPPLNKDRANTPNHIELAGSTKIAGNCDHVHMGTELGHHLGSTTSVSSNDDLAGPMVLPEKQTHT
jgi:hypothetical protein